MSAVTPIADKLGCGRIVRFVPIADIEAPEPPNQRPTLPNIMFIVLAAVWIAAVYFVFLHPASSGMPF
jgi:hypothetical protein